MSVTDYSKWDNIELSDDEEKTPDCIDAPYWARLMHQKRIDRESKYREEREKINTAKQHLESKIKKLKIENKKDQIKEDQAALDSWRQRETLLDEQIKKEPWNVDSIGQVKENTSRINTKTKIEEIALEDRYTQARLEILSADSFRG